MLGVCVLFSLLGFVVDSDGDGTDCSEKESLYINLFVVSPSLISLILRESGTG